MTTRTVRATLAIAGLALAATACGGGSSSPAASSGGTPLVGTFHLTAGSCSSTKATTPTGTYFRMIERGGSLTKGPFFDNPDSHCKDQSFSVEQPGTSGGLVTGTYQPGPTPAFDTHGNAQAAEITKPGIFTDIDFGILTNAHDPQTHTAVPTPSIIDTNGKLSGQITAWSAAWNNQYFNQGSPKPDGKRPGLTLPVTGTYNATTHAFVLTWASQIVGGPFDGFAGYWHLQGTFTPKSS